MSSTSVPIVPDVDERQLNRELSWLDFNARVLALGDEPTVPLLERVKFCAIFSSNLDEFFQVRVAALKDQVAAGIVRPTPDGRTPAQQLIEISDRVAELVQAQEELYLGRLVPTLRAAGVELIGWEDLDEDDRKYLVEVFEHRIFPVLTPLAVDPGHPFPYISNLSLNLAVLVREPESDERVFARVKVPSLLPRFLPLPDGARFVPLEQVIASQLPSLFPGMVVEDRWAFRVTRNADLTLEEEADDLLQAVEMELRRRRFGRAVRLEVEEGMSPQILDLLLRELDLEEDDVSHSRAPLDLTGLFLVHDLDRLDLKDEPWPPATQSRLAVAAENDKSLFSVLRERDVLVHHPYDSFATSTEEFIRQASEDPRVLTIKMTLYRTSGDSPIVRSLIRAAERGVQVAVLIEVKARFDEQANIAWAKQLERAGVHVVYGLVGLKTHSKCVLVVRDEDDGIRRYLHVGTGNYNSSTARLYEDIGLLSCDPALGADLTQLFNHLTGYSREVRYRKILVAPRWMRHQIQDLIMGEAAFGSVGRITMKLNSLVDPGMIDALVLGQRRRRARRPDRPGHLLLAPGRARAVGHDPRALARGSLPRALPHLPLRQRRRARAAGVLPRFGRPDAPQPRPPGGGHRADREQRAPGAPPGGARRRSGRRPAGVGARRRRRVAQGADDRGHRRAAAHVRARAPAGEARART